MAKICACQNCEWIGETYELDPIKDSAERVAPGEAVPSGECPECGALAHEVDAASLLRHDFLLDDSDAGHNLFFVGGEDRENPVLDAAYVFAINAALERDRGAHAPVGELTRLECVRHAVALLARARALLVHAQAPRAADKVRLALSSAKGAARHAKNKASRPAG